MTTATAFPSLVRHAALALLLCTLGGAAQAQDLNGMSFNITIMAAGGGEQKDHLKFTAKDLTCQTLGGMKTPYTSAAKKKSKATTFDATSTDATGNTIAINGEVEGQDVHGTITMTPKGGQAMVANFTSVKPNKK
jgi:hypothetical protein